MRSNCFPLQPSKYVVAKILERRLDTKGALSRIYTLLSSYDETNLDSLN